MVDSTQDSTQHAADATLSGHASSRTPSPTDDTFADEDDVDTKSASTDVAHDIDVPVATSDADDASPYSFSDGDGDATPINEDRWIQLYHHLLLVATLQPSKPVIRLNHPGALQLLDAYTEGLITAEGLVDTVPAQAGPEGIAVFQRVCENLVPSLIGRIEELSRKNLEGEQGDREPQWRFVITPTMITQYRRIRARFDVDDEIERPEDDRELREFLESIIVETQDTVATNQLEMGKRTRMKLRKGDNQMVSHGQQPLDERETFRRVGGVTQAVFRGEAKGSDLIYTQRDEIPDLRNAPRDTPADDEEEQGKNGEFYLLPTNEDVIVPRKSRKDPLWTYDTASKDWYRGDGKRWRPSLVLRQFRSDTNEYTRLYDRTDMLLGLDPNNKQWLYGYNKMINQSFRRYTGVKKVKHTFWTAAELEVMYKAVNKMVAEKGLDAFNFKFKKQFITTVMEGVNEAGGNARGFDTVSTKVRRRDGPIFDLLARAQALKARIQAGEQVWKEERYPEEAIAMPEDC